MIAHLLYPTFYTEEIQNSNTQDAVVVSSLSHAWFFCNPRDCSPPGSCVHGISLMKNTGVETEKLLHSKGNYKQGDKTSLKLGENKSKWNNWQRINFQNIQAARTTQYQKNKQPNQKVGKRPKQTFLQRRHTDG